MNNPVPSLARPDASPGRMRVMLLGATGTIGQATARALLRRGHEVVAFVRPGRGVQRGLNGEGALPVLPGVELRHGDVCQPGALARDGFRGERFDALVSCLASRTGGPRDAWAVDHGAHRLALQAASQAGVGHFVLLSAICVQKPLLAFQQAKLAFEGELVASGLRHSIVRPTAFFKSLSGQVERVRRGRPFLVFGDGALTACKPISDDDLGDYLAGCLHEPARWNRVLPIGGPGPAVTPVDQVRMLSALLGRPVPVRRVPVRLLDAVIAVLSMAGRVVPALADKAEFARIGRYYATESMLVWDAAARRYDAEATPSTGTQTLQAHYARMLKSQASAGLGDHAVF